MRAKLLICLFLISTTLIVYWQTDKHEFINYDDPGYVYDNPHIIGGLSFENFRWALGATKMSNWHPLTWFSHMVDCQLYGLNPKGHHLTNVFLHVINTVLLFFLLQLMTGALYPSALVAALFALHPLHVESVAWVSERKDLLSTFFFLLSLLAYSGYADKLRLSRYLLALFAFSLGLLCKPMIVTLPFVMLLMDFWPLYRIRLDYSRNRNNLVHDKLYHKEWPTLLIVLEKVPFFILSALSSVITYYVQQKGGSVALFNEYSFSSRIANALVAYEKYISKMLWPDKLAFIYPLHVQLPKLQVAGSIFLLLFITILLLWEARSYPFLIVGWLWFLGTLIPVIGLVQVGVQAMADRYTYLPLIGLFIIIAWGVPELFKGWRYRGIILSISATICLACFATVTYLHLAHWKNSITLFRYTLSITNDNFTVHNNLGVALAEQGQIGEAINEYAKAVAIKPNFSEAHYNWGVDLDDLGKVEEAIVHYSEALRINNNNANAHCNLGIDLIKLGKINTAISHLSQAVQIDPDDAIAQSNLIKALKIREENEGSHN